MNQNEKDLLVNTMKLIKEYYSDDDSNLDDSILVDHYIHNTMISIASLVESYTQKFKNKYKIKKDNINNDFFKNIFNKHFTNVKNNIEIIISNKHKDLFDYYNLNNVQVYDHILIYNISINNYNIKVSVIDEDDFNLNINNKIIISCIDYIYQIENNVIIEIEI